MWDQHSKGEKDAAMKRNVPYAIILPIAVVCFAVVLMIWAMSGTSGGGPDNASAPSSATTGRTTEHVTRAPTAPSNDTASDSARISGPLNKSR
jgi:hypothetical protein